MKIAYSFVEYQAMISVTNAILPEVLEGFSGLDLKDALIQLESDKRITVDHEKQEIVIEVPERFILGVSNILVKHGSAIGVVVKAVKAVAEAMKSLIGGMRDDVDELVNAELAEVEKEQKQAA